MSGSSGPARLLPLIAVCGAALFCILPAVVPSSGEMDLEAFGRMPVQDGGRIKPADTLARDSLYTLSGRETFPDESGRRRPASQWLLDMIARPVKAETHSVLRIENLVLIETLGLEKRKGFRYSLAEVSQRRGKLEEQYILAERKPPMERDAFEREALELGDKVHLYLVLNTSGITPAEAGTDPGMAVRADEWIAGLHAPRMVPPPPGGGDWLTLIRASVKQAEAPSANPSLGMLDSIFAAYRRQDAAAFNQAVAVYREVLKENPPEGYRHKRVAIETFMNRWAPFFRCSFLYLGAFILCCASWLGWRAALGRAALGVASVALAAHTIALALRIGISGHGAFGDLYASCVIVGWGCVATGLVLERIYRMDAGLAVAAASGFIILLIARSLGAGEDTHPALRAVLNSRFWLTLHVLTILMGYAAVFAAGCMGAYFILRGVFTRSMKKETARSLGGMIRGTVCFALLFSLVGTVLGGLWAEDSWGRFWGWDPKENGSLIIVLWTALVLHARAGALVRERGLAVLAVFGNVVTSWSWFGVNELGVGLHSYGFTEGTVFFLLLFMFTQLAIMGLGGLVKVKES